VFNLVPTVAHAARTLICSAEVPGVVRVVTAKDIPGHQRYGPTGTDGPSVARSPWELWCSPPPLSPMLITVCVGPVYGLLWHWGWGSQMNRCWRRTWWALLASLWQSWLPGIGYAAGLGECRVLCADVGA
jgi:hypothetical protein